MGRRIQEVLWQAGVAQRKPGELGIEGNRPEDAVETKLIFCNEIGPVGGHGGDMDFPGKGIRAAHAIPGRELHVKIFNRLFSQGLQELEIIREDDEAFPFFLEDLGQVKPLIAVAVGDDSAEIGVAGAILDQEHGAMMVVGDFTPHDGFDPMFLGGLEEKDEAVEVIGIREGEPLYPHAACGCAEFLDSSNAPSPGIMGMDV